MLRTAVFRPSSCCAQDWAGCRTENIAAATAAATAPSSSAEVSVTVSDLNPSSSYVFRLYTVSVDGQEVGPGPEIAFDTEGKDMLMRRESHLAREVTV